MSICTPSPSTRNESILPALYCAFVVDSVVIVVVVDVDVDVDVDDDDDYGALHRLKSPNQCTATNH